MDIKACLFDLDGVLVDTARFHFLAWKQLADKLGFFFTENDNERLKGVSRMDSLEILLEVGNLRVSDKEKNRFAAEKNQVYLDFIQQMTPEDVLQGAREFLIEVRDNKILTGLGSASKNARLIMEKTNLLPLFDVIVDGNLISHAKPDPEVFALGAHMLGVQNTNCVVFEDAVAGIRAAHNAAMKCVGIGSSEILKEADLVFPGLSHVRLKDLIFA
ncbi:MAG TPA: beta-phosphoglucomutase [Bacteroidales bacterium]|jgi:beta-phosphoglucomutase|nr:beta-phosphoglucomutase [Bacteroidales bacterium]